MAQYIDKAAIVAEIERLKKNEGWCQVGKDTADVYYARGFRFACEDIISFLDTLEVKETVDAEIIEVEDNNYSMCGYTHLEIGTDEDLSKICKAGDKAKVIIIKQK